MAHDGFVLNRRQLLGLFGGALLPGRSLVRQEQGPEFAKLDHFEFYVSNAEKSRDFFVRLFGSDLLNRNNKRYLKLGSSYMAFETPRANGAPGQVDHVSLSIRNLDMMRLHTVLEQRGVTYQDYPSGRDTAVLDPDGTRLQLSPENGWSLLNPATFQPETVAFKQDPIFRAIALDHVVFNVMDVERAVVHYRKILGSIWQRSGEELWFETGASRIGLATTPAGQKPGVRYICIFVSGFDRSQATRELQQLGAKMESVDGNSSIGLRDPDGLMIQVLPAQR